MQKECDVNEIMRKFQVTGTIEHVNKHGAEYGFAEAIEYQEAIELTRRADEMFAELPSSVRKKFDNKPEAFLDFVQKEENLEEMEGMGLLTDEAAERLQVARAAIKAEEQTNPPGSSETTETEQVE